MPTDPPDRSLTWALLLGRWMDLARASIALPETAEGGRLRSGIAPIIALQAITHALGEIDDLPPDERSLALDRAELLIRKHAGTLHGLWRGEPMPTELIELIDDARTALHAAVCGGIQWLLVSDRATFDHPAPLGMHLLEQGFSGDLFLPTPGVVMFRDSIVAFVRAPQGVAGDTIAEIDAWLSDAARTRPPQAVPIFSQVYRQMDFASGCVVRDAIVPEDRLVGGQPLLVPVLLDGTLQSVSIRPATGAELPDIEVVQLRPDDPDNPPTKGQ